MLRLHRLFVTAITACLGVGVAAVEAAPRVVVISLDGAKPDLVEEFLETGAIDRDKGLGRLRRHGVHALENITATPSVTAVSHIAIATGSSAVHNDIVANTFHPVAAPLNTTISGFAAPIGGYQINPLGTSSVPTAEPLWVRARAAGLHVVTATWPGSDGADIRIAGTLVQPAVPTRTNDYTLPFGAFGGLGARGFTLDAADFDAATQALVDQLASAGYESMSPVQMSANPLETLYCSPTTSSTCGTTNASGRTLQYVIRIAALDSTNDNVVNYDTLIVFESNAGIAPGPFPLPATGPAYLSAGGESEKFFFEGSGQRVGTAYFLAHLAPDLSTVRLVRYAANFIPRNSPVLNVVDDVNMNVGFWAPQPDFRIPERLSSGFTEFSDLELEAVYADQVKTFTAYQTAVALRALEANPNASLVMVYFEQPDGSGHQFTLTDPRQATNPTDAASVGRPGVPAGATGQDRHKVLRYREYVRNAYAAANEGVEAIIQAVGVDHRGEPLADVFVVSDHGMAPFHTAVSLSRLLNAAGVDTTSLALRTTGPATHVYVNLAGREAGGTVSTNDYLARLEAIAAALRAAKDPNRFFNPGGAALFTHVWTRPIDCGNPGFCTNDDVGQDSGDVVALMAEGYNFDGTQNPVVPRLGDEPATTSVYSVPNFYGAHGHDSAARSMSAILYAAGPSLKRGKVVHRMSNLDVAPTVLRILGVKPADTVDGKVLKSVLKGEH